LTFILNGGFLDDNNRFFLFKKTIESFSIFGSGIFGDRVVLDGTYPHNLFLELISHYGFIFGPFLIFLLLVNLLKGLFKENSSVKFFFISLLSIGFYKTIITGTYITEPGFYALIGILVCFANHKSSYLKVKYKNEISKGSFQF
jgi:hypothetical protein